MTTQDWIDRALAGNAVWNIGQIDQRTARALNRLVRQGKLIRCRGSFAGISPLKTIWCLDGAQFPIIEGVHVVEAHVGQVSP